jgi:hypothetical protein
MCIKILGKEEVEFNIDRPLMEQIEGAREIVINFDPLDTKIDFFVDKMEKMAQNGVSCQAYIKVNAKNEKDSKKTWHQ